MFAKTSCGSPAVWHPKLHWRYRKRTHRGERPRGTVAAPWVFATRWVCSHLASKPREDWYL